MVKSAASVINENSMWKNEKIPKIKIGSCTNATAALIENLYSNLIAKYAIVAKKDTTIASIPSVTSDSPNFWSYNCEDCNVAPGKAFKTLFTTWDILFCVCSIKL